MKALQSQIEQEQQKKGHLQSEIGVQLSEITHLKARESQLAKEVSQLREAKSKVEEELLKIKRDWSVDKLQMKELQDQLEAEQYFSTLYKTQANELREDLDEKIRSTQELEEERGSLVHQLQIALARADSEALARSIAEETVADLEKEKTMKELELKDLLAKHRTELSNKDASFNNLKERESEFLKQNEQLTSQIEDLNLQIQRLQDDIRHKAENGDIEKLTARLKTEQLLKLQAVNKLHEILNRKDINTTKGKNKVSSAELRRKEKDCRKLEQELKQEREKYGQLAAKWQKDLQVKNNLLILDFSKPLP